MIILEGIEDNEDKKNNRKKLQMVFVSFVRKEKLKYMDCILIMTFVII